MAWIILFIAGILEVVWAFAMKQSEGFTRLWPSVLTLVAMGISFALLSWSMRTLPLGTAYAVWTGIGAIGAFLVGIVLLGESANPMRVAAAIMIGGGILMMKLSSAPRHFIVPISRKRSVTLINMAFKMPANATSSARLISQRV